MVVCIEVAEVYEYLGAMNLPMGERTPLLCVFLLFFIPIVLDEVFWLRCGCCFTVDEGAYCCSGLLPLLAI